MASSLNQPRGFNAFLEKDPTYSKKSHFEKVLLKIFLKSRKYEAFCGSKGAGIPIFMKYTLLNNSIPNSRFSLAHEKCSYR